ncbi:MAG: hypothetical protein KU37_09555 [Sulfuricurvum sp. PC08-66]|nr:MAG: hypothetical protein KU37_09555 [Sulfuricurvum sp. PC08-66]
MDVLKQFIKRFEHDPMLMLPSHLPEDIFDVVYLQSLALLHAMGEQASTEDLDVDFLVNIVANILRMHDIYDMYRDDLSGLVVVYASWVILESLRREGAITFVEIGFDKLFDNDLLKDMLIVHAHAFQKKLSFEKIGRKKPSK